MRFPGIVSTLGDVRLGKNFKQRCLAHLGQADNASFHESGTLLRSKSAGTEFSILAAPEPGAFSAADAVAARPLPPEAIPA